MAKGSNANILAAIEALDDAESLTLIIDKATERRATFLSSSIAEAQAKLDALLALAGMNAPKPRATGRAPRGSAVKARDSFPPSLAKALSKADETFTAASLAKEMGAPNIALAGFVAGGLLVRAGEVAKAEGQRGKAAALFKLTPEGKKALKATLKD